MKQIIRVEHTDGIGMWCTGGIKNRRHTVDYTPQETG